MWGPMRVALFAVDLAVAFSAISGGLALTANLERTRFPVELLRGSPFHSYRLPGLILAVAVGGSSALAAALTLADPASGGAASAIAGAVLMGWIGGEIGLVRSPRARTAYEAAYFSAGLLMLLLGLAITGRSWIVLGWSG